jgi:hypothetical protein
MSTVRLRLTRQLLVGGNGHHNARDRQRRWLTDHGSSVVSSCACFRQPVDDRAAWVVLGGVAGDIRAHHQQLLVTSHLRSAMAERPM